MNGNNFLYEFGSYQLDERERVLTREGCILPLTPKAFETLLVLVRNSGHVVTKDDLMKQVWPNAYVEEGNLTQNIFALRRILGEELHGNKYIETVSRRGYRFVGAVRRVSGAAAAVAMPNGMNQADGQTTSELKTRRTIAVLAVLPFVNESAEAKMEYVSDGITESIINSLAELPRLRVMSRSAVFRYKGKELDAQRIGRQLGVDAVLLGRVQTREGRLVVSAELIDVANGWQLWGANYDRGSAILEVQDEISKQISATLRLRLTGNEELQPTKRYSESTAAYQAYLEARYYWSMFTREGLERATIQFQEAISLDPNYALAYAGIVDCYLRLATNYIPPADDTLATTGVKQTSGVDDSVYEAPLSLKVREEWDRKAAEREIKRAIELKAGYPAAHQWCAAYLFSKRLYDEASPQITVERDSNTLANDRPGSRIDAALLDQIQSSRPTQAEEVQIFCMIAREQIEAGNYEAASAVLQRWWTFGGWPKLEGLSSHSSADLLLTVGNLAGCVASTRLVPRGQKHAEALINGAIGIFQQLGSKVRCAEGKIELGYCHYREGLFDLARSTLQSALETLSNEDRELRSLTLIRLAGVERHAGRLHDALTRLDEAAEIVELAGPFATGRYHLELATTLRKLATTEMRTQYFDRSAEHYQHALHEFESAGDHRHAAIVENNYGFLLLTLKRLDEAEVHLGRARILFESFADRVKSAQVADTLARLYIDAGRFELAGQTIVRAVETLEKGGEEALLAEALTTQGIALCRLKRHREAKRVLDRANRVAESCGDSEGAGYALLIMIEEMCEQLENDERMEIAARMSRLLSQSQQSSILERLQKCLDAIARARGSHDGLREPQRQA